MVKHLKFLIFVQLSLKLKSCGLDLINKDFEHCDGGQSCPRYMSTWWYPKVEYLSCE